MHTEKITSPLADLENVNFLRFAGRLEKGEKHIEETEDIIRDMRPAGKDLDLEKRHRIKGSAI